MPAGDGPDGGGGCCVEPTPVTSGGVVWTGVLAGIGGRLDSLVVRCGGIWAALAGPAWSEPAQASSSEIDGASARDGVELRGMSAGPMLAVSGRRRNVDATAAVAVLRWARMSPRPCQLGLLSALACSACVPEPANVVELRQTLTEVVDLGRAMEIEHALVKIASDVDPAGSPKQLAAELTAATASAAPCAMLMPSGEAGVRIDFGPVEANCGPDDRTFVGALRVTYSEPTPGARLASITFVDLESDGSSLTGTTHMSWGVDDTLQIVSEIRLDSSSERQIEIQSERVVRRYKGALQIDGWARWQTLMGRWRMELGGWELADDALVPARGLATISTPYEHEVVLDFTGDSAEGLRVRANGGRTDLEFAVAPDGELIDLGDD